MRWRDKAAALLAVAACATVAGALAAAVACIPDLPLDVDTGDAEAGPPPARVCGDGIVQLDLGEQCDPGPNVPAEASVVNNCSTNTCKVQCPSGFVWDRNYHCYTFLENASSLTPQAYSDCLKEGHVVTFASEEELEAVVAPDAGGRIQGLAFWVGFNSSPLQYSSYAAFEPGWSPSCPGCFAHTTDASAPLPGAPTGDSVCVAGTKDLDASWQQVPCADGGKIRAVCEREPSGVLSYRCAAGVCFDLPWTFQPEGGPGTKHYVYVDRFRKADEAEQACVDGGGTLVVLQSRDEREQLWHALANMSPAIPIAVPDSIWIGLSEGDAGWVWDDEAGIDAYATPWASAPLADGGTRANLSQVAASVQPIDNTLARNDQDPSTTLPFVCQIVVQPPDAGDAGDAGDASDAPSADEEDAGD